jgi:hypothetical protein
MADEDLIMKLIQQIPEAQASLAKALEKLVKDLDLDAIITLTLELLHRLGIEPEHR